MPSITKASTPTSGAISFADLNTALRNSSGTEVSLGDGDVRSLLGVSSGSVDMNTAYNKFFPYGEVVYSTNNGDNSDGPYTFTSCDFGTDTDDRIILCVVTYYTQYGNVDNTGNYSLDTIASATIGGVSATCAGRMDGYTVPAGHREQMCVFYARPTGTSGNVVYSVNNAGWDSGTSYRAGMARTLTIYALYGLNTSNPIEYSVHTQKTDGTDGTYNLRITLSPDNSGNQKDKLLLLLTGRHYIDGTTPTNNYFYINSSSKTSDWQNPSTSSVEGQGALGYLTNDVPTTSTFTANSVTGDDQASGLDLETTCFIGIILAKNPSSAQTVSFAPSLTYTP